MAGIAELLGDKVIFVGVVAVIYLGWRHRGTHDIDIALVSLEPSKLHLSDRRIDLGRAYPYAVARLRGLGRQLSPGWPLHNSARFISG